MAPRPAPFFGGRGKFIVTETRFGAIGQTEMWDVAPTREQFRMWNLELAGRVAR
jgi:hypothetical protein